MHKIIIHDLQFQIETTDPYLKNRIYIIRENVTKNSIDLNDIDLHDLDIDFLNSNDFNNLKNEIMDQFYKIDQKVDPIILITEEQSTGHIILKDFVFKIDNMEFILYLSKNFNRNDIDYGLDIKRHGAGYSYGI